MQVKDLVILNFSVAKSFTGFSLPSPVILCMDLEKQAPFSASFCHSCGLCQYPKKEDNTVMTQWSVKEKGLFYRPNTDHFFPKYRPILSIFSKNKDHYHFRVHTLIKVKKLFRV